MCSVGGIRPVLPGKSLQHKLENSRSNYNIYVHSNIYIVVPLISEILV